MPTPLERLMTFPTAVRRDPAIDPWLDTRPVALSVLARPWFEAMRACGPDVRELMHDGHPTACVGQIAFGYVNVFTAHVNVGFFRGSELHDPDGLLIGSGKLMRHVKLRPEGGVDEAALRQMIKRAYDNVRNRL
jgi:hypothetical protein